MTQQITIADNVSITNLNNNGIVDAEKFEDFMKYLAVKPKSLTARNYRTYLKHFYLWLQVKGITQPTREDIVAYIEFLDNADADTLDAMNQLNNKILPPLKPNKDGTARERKPRIRGAHSAGTQNQYLRAVKAFFNWAEHTGIYTNVAINLRGAKVDNTEHKRDNVTKAEAKKIVDKIDTDTEAGTRDLAMILLCHDLGLRIIELHRANICDIEHINDEHRLYIQGKGKSDKSKYKKIPPQTMQVIEDYLDKRSQRQPYEKTDALFTGTNPQGYKAGKTGRLAEPSISRIIKQRLKNAGIDSRRKTAHSLRHSFVTNLAKLGYSDRQIQQQARHKDPKTTNVYRHDIENQESTAEVDVHNYVFNDADADQIAKENKIIAEQLKDLTPQQKMEIVKEINKLRRSNNG